MVYKVFIISLFFVFWTNIHAQDQVAYIRKYQDLAIAEMMRTGIPASIKPVSYTHLDVYKRQVLSCVLILKHIRQKSLDDGSEIWVSIRSLFRPLGWHVILLRMVGRI